MPSTFHFKAVGTDGCKVRAAVCSCFQVGHSQKPLTSLSSIGVL